ncbi:hypothetical protein AN1V17_16900 [Vallitalea sediminicola]
MLLMIMGSNIEIQVKIYNLQLRNIFNIVLKNNDLIIFINGRLDTHLKIKEDV